jgi:hypothetical protein
MSVFHGDKHDEDPEEFLKQFLQCTKNGDDFFRARNFVNYLQAYSMADEWFEELPEDEKRSWASIEVSFRREWLKQEIVRPKEVTTIENEPRLAPMPSQTITPDPYHKTNTENGTQDTPKGDVERNESQDVTAALPTITTTPPDPQPPLTAGIIQNPCQDTPKQLIAAPGPLTTPQATTTHPNLSQAAATSLSTTVTETSGWPLPHQKSVLLRGFSQSELHMESPASPAVVSNIKMRPETAGFTKNRQNIEISPNFTKTTPKTLAPSIVGPTDDITEVYASILTPNDAISSPITLATSASSSQYSQLPAGIRDEKSALLRAVFELQGISTSPAPTTVVMAFETRPASANFIKNHQKSKKSAVFAQKTPERRVSMRFGLADDASGLPFTPSFTTALKTRSELAAFMENHQKLEKTRFFNQTPLVSGDLESEDNVYSSSAPTTIVIAFKTRSASTIFTKKRQKVENSLVFNQNHPKSPISGRFKRDDSTDAIPTPSIAPTKHPCDLSSFWDSAAKTGQSMQRGRCYKKGGVHGVCACAYSNLILSYLSNLLK